MWNESKAALGALALVCGVLLVIGGLFVFIMSGYVIDPTIAGGGQSEGLAAVGYLAASIGALSCLAALLPILRTSKMAVMLAALPSVLLGIWGIVFGNATLSVIYHNDTLCFLCIAMGITLALVGVGMMLHAGGSKKKWTERR